MSDGKWVEDLRPAMAIQKAAKVILNNRLDALAATWSAVLTDEGAAERVHALRVTSRRASAAVRAMGNTLGPERKRKLTKLLHRLRRAAGGARDADVLLERLQKWTVDRPDRERPGLDILLGATLARRAKALTELQRTIRWRAKFAALRRKLEPRRHGNESLAARAAAKIPKIAAAFDRAAGKNLCLPRNLHRLRVSGKRFRYALELYVSCYPNVVRDQVYPAIEAVQDVLGAAHDAFVHGELVADARLGLRYLGDDVRLRALPGLDALADDLRSICVAGPARFAEWHAQWQILMHSIDFAHSISSE